MISKSIWHEAIETGKKGVSCELKYKTCALNPDNLDKFTRKIRLFAKPKK